ncbi:MAG: adenylate/guanylate cyclase domain-containing protein, partial [Nitrospirota bacterium]|nr:adenylate/guanylate cyclase domain-containing protein [Nitrospirota bacterium]
AIAMEEEMTRLNREWQEHGLPAVRMRIGIQTGPVVVGSLGSAQRLKFTTLGDSVNIAARLESFQKDSAEWWVGEEVCRILIGDTTKQYLGEHLWSLKEVGVVSLKGKAIGVSVYRLYSRKKN